MVLGERASEQIRVTAVGSAGQYPPVVRAESLPHTPHSPPASIPNALGLSQPNVVHEVSALAVAGHGRRVLRGPFQGHFGLPLKQTSGPKQLETGQHGPEMAQQGPFDPPQGWGTTSDKFLFLWFSDPFLAHLLRCLVRVACFALLNKGGHPLDPKPVMETKLLKQLGDPYPYPCRLGYPQAQQPAYKPVM